MTNGRKVSGSSLTQGLKEALAEIQGERPNALDEFRDILMIGHALFQRESNKLEKKLGESHPRTRQIKARLVRNLTLASQLEIESQISRIKVPEVPERGAQVHGRVVDVSDRGLAGLSVFGESEKGRKLRVFGSVETNNFGYYAIQVEKEVLKKLQNTEIYLAVGIALGKVIHREEKPLELKPDSRLTINIELDRKILRQTKTPTTPPKKSPVKNGEDAGETDPKEGGTIDITELRGIGPKTAEKLRKAGIKDIGTFMEKDDAELQAIMGNIKVAKIKKDNSELLRRVKGS
jgi:predicted flap endonuclease-1-like 5' DNA nuclease